MAIAPNYFYFLSKSEKNTPDGFVGFYINNHIAYGFPGSILYENISVFNKIEKRVLQGTLSHGFKSNSRRYTGEREFKRGYWRRGA